jgi:uncharacterized protein YeaO (DUF488 family)
MATARQPTSRRSTRARPTRTRRAPGEYSSPACYLHELDEAGHPAADREPHVDIRRIYDATAHDGSYRVLVDRLWPRGIRKEQAALDEWARELAPSPDLRKWFGHDPERFAEFRKRYLVQLRQHSAELETLRQRAQHQPVTLLYGAKDARINHAVVLRDVLLKG